VDIVNLLAFELKVTPSQAAGCIALLGEGATVPFIARYRKERTGNLNEEQIRLIEHKYAYFQELESRKNTIIESLRSQDKLSAELEKKILSVTDRTGLEDLYLPYRPKRSTRGTKAKEAGLEPFARRLLEPFETSFKIEELACQFLNPEKGLASADKVISGASDILAEEISENPGYRKWLRDLSLSDGLIVSGVRKDFKNAKTKFEMYYDFQEPVKTLPSHRYLAMLRGENEKVLSLHLKVPDAEVLRQLEAAFIKFPKSPAASILKACLKDAFERLLLPATETEVRKILYEKSEDEAFSVFADNLKTLLLSPPAGQKPVLALDPGFRTGCKVAALDSTGKFLEYQAIFPNEPHNKKPEAKNIVLRMIRQYGIKLVAVGNGTASRETEGFIRSVISEISAETRPLCVIVSEAGASVYSASPCAIKEFPGQDVTVRGSISIGRRLQDPLSELVKIDPKSIGVGQYQHDLNQTKLKARLEEVVESCVNKVGVNVNLGSEELLKYVSGLNQKTAKNIVAYRNENGQFRSRNNLKKVPGLGDKTFEQAAGFLRIPNAENPLDNSAVHPERYSFVGKMAAELKTTIKNLIGNTELIRSIDKDLFVTEDIGLTTLNDIINELGKPGLDPREAFHYASFSENITEISHLKEGMVLEGTVTNITNFGAFVDLGVHQDGLVHISELADTFVKDPFAVVKAGQIVKVSVLKVDTEQKRISLSMKKEKTRPALQK